MNRTDYDKKHAIRDADGSITAKDQSGIDADAKPRPITYRGHTIDVGLGNVKVWDSAGQFVGDYPDVASAKSAIN